MQVQTFPQVSQCSIGAATNLPRQPIRFRHVSPKKLIVTSISPRPEIFIPKPSIALGKQPYLGISLRDVRSHGILQATMQFGPGMRVWE